MLPDYEALGRIKGSIEAAVERALAAADAEPKIPRDRTARLTLLRRGLIPWLSGVDPDTGSPLRRVARMSEIPAEALPLVQLLVEQRLLATDISKDTGEKTIEPAHEALLRQWGLLQGWLDEDFGALTVLGGVHRAARDWGANDRDAAWLSHTGGRLEEAERLRARPDLAVNLEPTELDYLRKCRQRDDAETNAKKLAKRNQLRLISTLLFGPMAVGVLVMLMFAFMPLYREFYLDIIEDRQIVRGISGLALCALLAALLSAWGRSRCIEFLKATPDTAKLPLFKLLSTKLIDLPNPFLNPVAILFR
jgi:hypothetical protein